LRQCNDEDETNGETDRLCRYFGQRLSSTLSIQAA
jgi:hypothetical protein